MGLHSIFIPSPHHSFTGSAGHVPFFSFFFKVCLVLNVYKVKTPKRHKQFVDNHHESYHKENEVFVYSDKEFVFFDGYFSVLISKCDRHFPSL